MRCFVLFLFIVSPACGCSRKAESPKELDAALKAQPLPNRINMAAAQADPGERNKEGKAPADAVERRIRYTADVSLITEDFPKAEGEVAKLVSQFKGYVAHSDIAFSPGQLRQGAWKLRIPAAAFEEFRTALLKIAEVEKNTTDSEDLTEEYHDLERHIKNKLQEEEGWRKLMDKSSDKLESFLAMKKELENIRDYIDRKQGKLKLLANLTDLATVNLKLRERQKYESAPAPQLTETPTFWMRVGRTFSDSLDGLVGVLQSIALVITALVPWSPALAALAAAAWALVRKSRRGSPPPAVVSGNTPATP